MLIKKCIRLNLKSVLFILLSQVINHVRITSTAHNDMMPTFKPDLGKRLLPNAGDAVYIPNKNQDRNSAICSRPDIKCNEFNFPCIDCHYNTSCIYGDIDLIKCEVVGSLHCKDERTFHRPVMCRYCYQTENWEHKCYQQGNCKTGKLYKTNCTVDASIACLGNRTFNKNIMCNWTHGIRWSTALIVSITLGGFGADRFYLGHWQEGIGKLFSFGGLGVWTLVDVILISLHYLGPADGSLYI